MFKTNMMKNLSTFSEAQLLQLQDEIEELREQLSTSDLILSKGQVMSEQQVCALLGVTCRTMQRYRNAHLLHYIKLHKQIYYIKILLILDLLKHCKM